MAISVLVMLVFAALLMLWDFKNKYFLFFSLMLFGMALAMLTLLVEISKASNYLAEAGALLGDLERRVYLLVRVLPKLSLSTLAMLRMAGVTAYMVTIVFYVYSFRNNLRHDKLSTQRKKRPLVPSLLLLSLPALIFFFYSPMTAYWLYLRYHAVDMAARERLGSLVFMADLGMRAVVALYLSYPPLFLIRNHLRNKITFFSEQLFAQALSLFLMNLLFFAMFFAGPFSPSAANVFASGFWRYQPMTKVPTLYTTYLPVIAVGLSGFLFTIITRYKINHLIAGMKRRGVKKNLGSLYTNVRNILHGNKNLLFSIKVLAESVQNSAQDDDSQLQAQKIVSICDRNLKEITRTLNSIRQLDVKALQGDLVAVIDEALARTALPVEVRVERELHVEGLTFAFDHYHLVEALSNLLANSVEALLQSDQQHPLIRLTLYQSNEWVFFSVFDNGGGVPKKLVRKIHKPYVTTKSKGNSWGIGLAYVFSVVGAHYGHIRVRSKEGEFTVVEVLLPNKQRRLEA